MRALQRIIAGHDFQRGGHLALCSAIELASRCNAEIKLVHVVEPYPLYQRLAHPLTAPYSTEELVERTGGALQKLIDDRQTATPHITYEVRTGKPFVELIVARRAWQADLLVVGTQSKGQSLFLGSTAERVVRKAVTPVLVAKKALSATPKTIVIPIDFSECAMKAAQEALAFVQHFGGHMVFLHVLELPSAAAVGYGPTMGSVPPMSLISPEEIEPEWQAFFAALLLPNGVSYEYETIKGRPPFVIVETAEKREADLIVMGTHGRTGLPHMLLGSVAEEVVRQSTCPILTIRPDALPFSLP